MFAFQIRLQAKLDLAMPSEVGADAKSIPLQIHANGYAGSVTLKVKNMLGKVVLETSAALSSEPARASLDLSVLGNGKYFVVAEVNGKTAGACAFIRRTDGRTASAPEKNARTLKAGGSSAAFLEESAGHPASVRILPAAREFDKITLYNMLGKEVYSRPVPKNLPPEGLTLDFRSIKSEFGAIPNGIYILSLSSSTDKTLRATQKVVISN